MAIQCLKLFYYKSVNIVKLFMKELSDGVLAGGEGWDWLVQCGYIVKHPIFLFSITFPGLLAALAMMPYSLLSDQREAETSATD